MVKHSVICKKNHAEYDKIAFFLILDCAKQRRDHYHNLNSLRDYFPIATEALEAIRGRCFEERTPVSGGIRSRIDSYYK